MSKTFSTQDLTRRTYGAAPAADESMLALDAIRLDGGTQPRAEINWDLVVEYATEMRQGTVFPPVDVFFDGENYWLADGFHRYHAALNCSTGPGALPASIKAKVHQGTQRDAQLFSFGVNTHGLPRTSADKERAVTAMLTDAEWSRWSDREIARQCKVSAPYVGKLREELSVNGLQIDATEAARELSVNGLQMEARPGLTQERRERLAPLLNHPADHVMGTIADEVSLTVGDLVALLDLEQQGRQRPSVVKFITNAIYEESRTAPGAAQPAPEPPAPPEPETRTVQRGGTTYQQKVSSEKRSEAAQARQPAPASRPPSPAPKPSAAPAPAPRYEDKPRVGVWRIRDEADWIEFSDRMMALLQQGEVFEIEVRMA